jgi:hypothetical protein
MIQKWSLIAIVLGGLSQGVTSDPAIIFEFKGRLDVRSKTKSGFV